MRTALAACCLAAAAGATSAESGLITADYYIEGFPAPDRRLEVTIIADLDSLSGVGEETSIVSFASIAEYLNDIGQVFSVADLTDPPDAVTPGNLIAGFLDGQTDPHRLMITIGEPGTITYSTFRDVTNNFPLLALFAGDAVVYGASIFFVSEYILDGASVTTELRCTADYDDNGVLDFLDVILFLTLFSEGDPAADLAGPVGTFDFNDVIAFLGYFAGCP